MTTQGGRLAALRRAIRKHGLIVPYKRGREGSQIGDTERLTQEPSIRFRVGPEASKEEFKAFYQALCKEAGITGRDRRFELFRKIYMYHHCEVIDSD